MAPKEPKEEQKTKEALSNYRILEAPPDFFGLLWLHANNITLDTDVVLPDEVSELCLAFSNSD